MPNNLGIEIVNNDYQNKGRKMKNADKKLLINCVKHTISWEENMDRAFTLKKIKGLFNESTFKKVPTIYYNRLNKLLSNLEK